MDFVQAFLDSGKNLTAFLRLVANDPTSISNKTKMFNTFIRAYSGANSTGFGNIGGKAISGIFNLIKTQELSTIPTITDQIIKFSDAEKLLVNSSGEMKGFLDILTGLIKGTGDLIGGQVLLYLNEQNGLLEEINTKTSLTGDLSKNYREELTETIAPLTKIGVGLNEVTDATTSLINQTGRFNLLSSETWVESAKVAKAYVGTLNDMVTSFVAFERVGVGAKDTTKYLEMAGKNSLNVGIESRKTTKIIQENIGQINSYGFKNGIQGLSEMAKKSIEFRMNMQTTFSVAEKLFDLDSVLEMSSNLQVLGGAIGDFADPLKLMYMATNDVEGLQDAIIGASKGLATYNTEQKKFEITGANLRIARDRAKALGIEYTEFATTAIAANERVQASMDLMGVKGLDDNPALKEFLTNMARMDGGEMKITIPGDLKDIFGGKKEVTLKDVGKDPALLQAFKTYQEDFKKLSKEEIIENQASNIKNIERNVSFMAATLRVQAGKVGGQIAEQYGIDFIKQAKEYTKNFTVDKDGVKQYMDTFNKFITDTFGDGKPLKTSSKVKSITTEPPKEVKKEQSTNTSQTNNVSKSELTVFIKNDGALFDAITREMLKDPAFAKTISDAIVKERTTHHSNNGSGYLEK